MTQHVVQVVLDLQETVKKKQLQTHNYNQDIFKGENKMPAKKEEVDCAVECAALKKEVAALKKEVAALKKEIKEKSSGSTDPRIDELLKLIIGSIDYTSVRNYYRKK